MVGKFISFEGSDGAGKTTVLKRVLWDLDQQFGSKLVATREPGGNPISEAIRQLIVAKSNTKMDSRTEALLFSAARRQHLVETVLPALAENKLVISDRYVDSSVAYQGAGRQIGEQEVWEMNQFATGGLMPDFTIYLDIPVEVGIERIQEHRQNEVNRLDGEQIEFYQRIRQAYLRLYRKNPERITLIDANQPLKKVVTDVEEACQKKLAIWMKE